MSYPDKGAKAGWLSRLKSGLSRTSQNLNYNLDGLLNKRRLDEKLLEELEDILIAADLGLSTATKLTTKLARTHLNGAISTGEVKEALADAIAEILGPVAQPFVPNPTLKPHVVLFCGVNGSGKTTTMGKPLSWRQAIHSGPQPRSSFKSGVNERAPRYLQKNPAPTRQV